MWAFIEADWRCYPAALLTMAGALLTLRGARRCTDGLRRPYRDPTRALTFVEGLRLAIVGLALAGVGAAWAWTVPWLLALSLAVGGEEALETSIAVGALRRAARAPSVKGLP
ncbi:MAG: hypothetical protein U0531_09415 [Dehalococcoidia bacterium]